jgi:hypothetical protein
MKIGIRKPSIKKSIKARTTGKIKRSIKKATVPAYGKKGTGVIKDPKKAVYNKVYNKTTVSVVPKIDFGSKSSTRNKQSISSNDDNYIHNDSIFNHDPKRYKWILSSRNLKIYLLIFSAQIIAFFWIPLMAVSMPAMIIMLFYICTSKNITVLDTYTGIKQVMSRTEYKKLKEE